MLSKGSQAYGQIRGCLLQLQEGIVVAIDPSIGSMNDTGGSQPAWAVYRGGLLVATGRGDINPDGTVWERLHRLVHIVRNVYKEYTPDVVVFEDIPAVSYGRDAKGHASLLKAVGAILSVSGPDYYVGLMPSSWKRMARPEYIKSDINDAVEMGYIAIEQAKRISWEDPPGRTRGKGNKKQAPTPPTRSSGAGA